jgi:hypothetical protein
VERRLSALLLLLKTHQARTVPKANAVRVDRHDVLIYSDGSVDIGGASNPLDRMPS